MSTAGRSAPICSERGDGTVDTPGRAQQVLARPAGRSHCAISVAPRARSGIGGMTYSGMRKLTRRRGGRAPHPVANDRASQGQQPVQVGRDGARHIHYLRPARGARDERDRPPVHAKRGRDRGERCVGGPAVHGPCGDPDHQRAIVPAAHAGARGPGPDPDSDAHRSSVPAA